MGNHNKGTKWIWIIFLILLIITTIEVILGIIKPKGLVSTELLHLSLLNWSFLILTILKAYYIVWYFMHLKDEKKGMRLSVTLPLYIFIPYLAFIVLIEAAYTYDILG